MTLTSIRAKEAAMSQQAPARSGTRWTEADVPDQSGRTAVVTGANSGIGFEVARVLASRGARVILACRDTARARDAADRIRAAAPGAGLGLVRLDLASLASVREAAGELRSVCGQIDLLINNAGVMMTPYGVTADGFERQLGINHLGHFALTGLLLDRLAGLPGARVVTVSSNAHKFGRIDFGDLDMRQGYKRDAGYGRSKLANLLFTYELQRRLSAAGAQGVALAAHPGLTRTHLGRYLSAVTRAFYVVVERPLGHSAARGALPVLRAATDASAHGGDYYGPDGWHEERGFPRLVEPSAAARDTGAQRRLWQESERLTEVSYAI
jgi:NAD(P)-dependent dehydrogenase (short-subunit alcohol dehydrogenase family)